MAHRRDVCAELLYRRADRALGRASRRRDRPALLAAAAICGLAGITVVAFLRPTLVLLGIGWNFGFVGASALVLETHRPEERTRVQSFNDFLVFGTMAVGSFSSGQLLTALGWAAVNWVVLPAVVLALVALAASGALRGLTRGRDRSAAGSGR